MSKDTSFAEAVACTSSGSHVEPIKLKHYEPPAGLAASEAHVDAFGNMVVRSYDGTFVMIDLKQWEVLDKLARFAKRRMRS
jgi:hypothetical protein